MPLRKLLNTMTGLRLEIDEPAGRLILIEECCRYSDQCADYNPKTYECNAPQGHKPCYVSKEVEFP